MGGGWSAAGAYGASVSAKGGRTAFQGAAGMPPEIAGLPNRLAAGLGWFSRGTGIEGSNAVYQEAELAPGLAAAYPAAPESPWRAAAGLAFPIGRDNIFNAAESRTWGMDAGVQGSYAFPGSGRAALGFAYHSLVRPGLEFPEGSRYRLPGWMEWSADWTSAHGMVHARMDLYVNESRNPSEGPSDVDRVGAYEGRGFLFNIALGAEI